MRPLANARSGLTRDHDCNGGKPNLIAWFRIWDPVDTNRGHSLVQESAKSPEAIGAQFQMVTLSPPSDRDRKSIKIGAGFGPWTAETNLELREDAIATLEAAQYRLRGLQPDETKERESFSVSVHLEPTPNRPEIELWLVAVTKSGKLVEPTILTEHGVGINNEINSRATWLRILTRFADFWPDQIQSTTGRS